MTRYCPCSNHFSIPLASFACTWFPSSLSTFAASQVPANETSTVSPTRGGAGGATAGFASITGCAPPGRRYSPGANHFSIPLASFAWTRCPSIFSVLAGSQAPANDTSTLSPSFSTPGLSAGASVAGLSPGLVSVLPAARNSPGLNHDSRPVDDRARTRSPSIQVTVPSTQLSPNLISILSPTLGGSARAAVSPTANKNAPTRPHNHTCRCDMQPPGEPPPETGSCVSVEPHEFIHPLPPRQIRSWNRRLQDEVIRLPIGAQKSAPNAGALQGRESHTRFVVVRGWARRSDRPAIVAGAFQSLFPRFFAVAAVPGFFELVKLDGPPLRPFAEDLGDHPGAWHQHLIRHLVDFRDGPGV